MNNKKFSWIKENNIIKLSIKNRDEKCWMKNGRATKMWNAYIKKDSN